MNTDPAPSRREPPEGWDVEQDARRMEPQRGTRYSDIKKERPDWLVPGLIAAGTLSIIIGEAGLGKSLYTVRLAADLSRKGFGSLLLSAEDSEAMTVRPRLEAAGANLDLVWSEKFERVEAGSAPDGRDDSLVFPEDVSALRDLIAARGVGFVVVDPINAYLTGGIDSHKDKDVRRALAPLAHLAAELRVAVVLVMHLNKGNSNEAWRRVNGSTGYLAAARSGLLFARDPDDPGGRRRVVAHTKCNIADLAESQSWEIVPAWVPHSDGGADIATAQLVCLGPSRHGAAVLLRSPANDEDSVPRDEAADFLREQLAPGPRARHDVVEAANAGGIMLRTLERAAHTLGVVSSRRGAFGGGAEWSLPIPANPPQTGRASATVAGMEEPSIHAGWKAVEGVSSPHSRQSSNIGGNGGNGGNGQPSPALQICRYERHLRYWCSVASGTWHCETCIPPGLEGAVAERYELAPHPSGHVGSLPPDGSADDELAGAGPLAEFNGRDGASEPPSVAELVGCEPEGAVPVPPPGREGDSR